MTKIKEKINFCTKNPIIAAYAGSGKTTFANMYPNLVTDFVCMPYKYYLEDTEAENEKQKANTSLVMHDEWPENYINAIKHTIIISSKILIIPSDFFVLRLLRLEDIPYTLCYPQRAVKELYRKRYIDRGNSNEFIDIFIGRWDNFLDGFEKDTYAHHIIFESNQFLSDAIFSDGCGNHPLCPGMTE